MDELRALIPTLATVLVVAGLLFVVSRASERIHQRRGGSQLASQFLLVSISIVGVLAVILALPVEKETRKDLLSLCGIVLSATIALSSTTFMGNAMAGLMLRAVRSFRTGDFVSVEGHFGRVSERGLMHTELQTEDRDLTTLPNLYLATHPVRVIRSSGTVISTTLSLGYDLDPGRIEELLLQAAEATGLEEPFVQVVELGDFAVTYRVAGLLTEVKHLVSVRSRLRRCVLDTLHGADVEIVSPNFMNTRQLPEGRRILPARRAPEQPGEPEEPGPEDVIFDKAEEAEQRERLELEAAERKDADASKPEPSPPE